MRKRHTRHTDPDLEGPSTPITIRVPDSVLGPVKAIVESRPPDIHNLTDAVSDALWLWRYEHERLND